MADNPHTTTDGGAPVASDEYSLTVGPDGPILLQDHYLLGHMQIINAQDPIYAPNSYGGPKADPQRVQRDNTWEVDGAMVREANTLHADDDDWGQAGTLVRDVFDDGEEIGNRIADAVNGG